MQNGAGDSSNKLDWDSRYFKGFWLSGRWTEELPQAEHFQCRVSGLTALGGFHLLLPNYKRWQLEKDEPEEEGERTGVVQSGGG